MFASVSWVGVVSNLFVAQGGVGRDPVTIRFNALSYHAPSSMPKNKNPLSARIIGLTKLLHTREESAS